MSSIFEKIVFIVLGGMTGFVVSITLKVNLSETVYICSIGILLAIIFIFWKRYSLSVKEEKLRSETVALITHEMRTSLTSTSWAVSYVLNNYESVISAEDKKSLTDIVDSIHTTVMHTVNLLDVSLLDIGKLSISLQWTELDKVEEMIREIIKKYEIGAKKDGINLITQINLDNNKKVEVDNLRLRIIIENLLENALQYTTKSSGWIKVDVSNTPNDLNIVIADNGIGIPQSEQGEIFKEFYRASNARDKLSSGSGIGLHMCAQYVAAHHGNIRFESKEGIGTTFYITLPLKTSADTKEFLKQI